MERRTAPGFFFVQAYQQGEDSHNALVSSLYDGLAPATPKNNVLKKIARKTGKESTIQKLCELLNMTMDGVLEMDLDTARRHLIAYHVRLATEAHEVKRQNEATKR